MPDSTKTAPDVPLAAIDIVTEVLHGEPTTSRINANYLAWKALVALQEEGYPIRWVCSGCCNCALSNFTDPLCDGKGNPIA